MNDAGWFTGNPDLSCIQFRDRLTGAPDFAKATSRPRRSSLDFLRAKAGKNAPHAVEARPRLSSQLLAPLSPGGSPSARFTDFAERAVSTVASLNTRELGIDPRR